MSDLYWLTDEQMARLQPYFTLPASGRVGCANPAGPSAR